MRVFLLTLLLFVMSASSFVWAQDDGHWSEVTPVLHEGRIKPMDSFARVLLRHIHGAEAFEGRTAMDWLREVREDPAAAARRSVLRIDHVAVKRFYDLDQTRKYFSVQDLGVDLEMRGDDIDALLQVPERDLTQAQSLTLDVYQNLLVLAALMRGEGLVYATPSDVDPGRLQMEVWYNGIKPYVWAMGFYGLALFFGLCVMMKRQSVALHFAAFSSLFFGVLMHGGAIVARVYILERPPVGTLYESVLFVGLVCGIWALISCLRRPQVFHLFVGALAALGVLLLAPYATTQAETKEMLVAVLNTNFWLATHVLIITAGYGLCILCACLAHIAFFVRGEGLFQSVYRVSIAALSFMVIGTILGGIWADQSWGRFWGWDPKENGALLIVLWLIWLQHGRHSGHLRGARFLAGCAFLNIVVALSWFGVNLLGVGLHSYGFIHGMAFGLSCFCSAQILLIAGLWIWRGRGREQA